MAGRGTGSERSAVASLTVDGVEMGLADAGNATAAVLMVGGIGGGFDSPASGLYDRLFNELPEMGVSALRVRFRRPGDLEAATADVLAGVEELARRGVERVVLVGHSFGGAVVIRAGVADERVAAVCTLSAQSHGSEHVAELAARPLLAIHGSRDPVLAASCSQDIVRRAGDNARLELVDGAGHTFDAEADVVHDLVKSWLVEQLGAL